MSLKILTSEFMVSTTEGTGMRRSWFPRIVAEAFLGSTKDGEVSRAPDPVTMVDGDLYWYNNSPSDQYVIVMVTRAPRSIIVQSPGTTVIHDAWSWDIAISPRAEYPGVAQNTAGGRFQIDRGDAPRDTLAYGRVFLDFDARQEYVDVGVVPARQAMHFRHLTAVQTPGIWVLPSEYESRNEAHARWVRLVAFACPVQMPSTQDES